MLTEEQIKQFKERLLEEKERIEDELAGIVEKKSQGKGDFEVKYPDFREGEDVVELDEEADEVEEYATELSLEATLKDRLDAINKALDKIEKGTYGKCEVCGADIPIGRLNANPEALTCIEHAEQ